MQMQMQMRTGNTDNPQTTAKCNLTLSNGQMGRKHKPQAYAPPNRGGPYANIGIGEKKLS
jgi:hypothetical protein